jgi:5-oxoprolinase (ATP-hydrolysing)
MWTFWIDRGGTFTDVVATDPEGRVQVAKTPSRSSAGDDPVVGVMRDLMGVAAGAPFPGERVAAIRIGTTVATNALLERKGARTVLVTTRGFADALLIGDQTRPDLFALNIAARVPLFEHVIEADERLAADGAVVRPLGEAALGEALARAKAEGLDSVAIAFLHADLDPIHERRARDLAVAAGFRHVTMGSEASPLPRFLPRAETTVADAYLTPALEAYVERLAAQTNGAPLSFMTSSGGLARAGAFKGRDAILSGPAGGAVGVARVADECGAGAVLGFDMGGTSTDVCRFAGALERKAVATVAGVTVRAPMLDVQTVAAGGGSILAFDGLRARVGPQSAGAEPGPAAYGLGGPATVTDANIVLGRLDPAHFPAVFGPTRNRPLDVGASHDRLSALAEAMGVSSAEAAAEGFLAIAVEQVAAAISAISTARGFDPRDHAMVAFGGAAGQVACQVADALGVEEVLCPAYGSVLSAWGIGHATLRATRQSGLERALDETGLAAADILRRRVEAEATAAVRSQGAGSVAVHARVHVRYAESDTALAVPFGDVVAVHEAFAAAHQRLFGFVEADQTPVIESVEVEALEQAWAAPTSAPPADLAAPTEGPALVVRPTTQIWVAPGWTATPDAGGLIRLRRTTPSTAQAAAGECDPVTLELFNRRFMGVAEAMGAALERTARSVNIKERLDFSCALFGADGELVANAPHMPVHLGSMGASVRAVRDRRPELKAGDAFALNNPYAGGTHLPDITVVMPVFAEGGAAASFFVAARGHHADVGGVQPGSMPPFSTTLAEEGVLLDALPILRGGVFLEDDVAAALTSGPYPARAPERNIADLKAQIAACRAGALAVHTMMAAHGAATVSRYMTFVQDNAEACVRRAIGGLTDGMARVPMDGGGEIVVRVTVDRVRGEATLDFRDSADQLGSNFNAPSAIVDAAALYVFRTLIDDDIPLNAGCLKPLKVLVREGSMLAPQPPHAVVAGNVETSQHLVDALYAALGVMANSQGSMNNFTFGDRDRQYYETLCGGAGATATAPGAHAVHTHMTNSRLTDPEILERRFPVRLEAFGRRPGSGGDGAHRGGDGAIRKIEFLRPMQAALLSTRREHAPRGLDGGGAGEVGRQCLIGAGGALKELPGCFAIEVAAGESIEIRTPGGGGFGPPPEPSS